jgi:hypothetical protein
MYSNGLYCAYLPLSAAMFSTAMWYLLHSDKTALHLHVCSTPAHQYVMYTSSTQRQGLSLLRIKICQSNNTAVRTVQNYTVATRVVTVTYKFEVYR